MYYIIYMDYEKNREFIKDYVSSVIEDLGPMIETLMDEGNHTDNELEQIFLDHVSKTEFNRFCDIYNDLVDYIGEGIYMDPWIIINNYEHIFDDDWEYENYLDVYDDYYKQYMDKKNKKKKKRKNKKNKKNTDNEEVVETLSFNIPQDGLAENFYLSASITVKQEGDFGLNYIPIKINGNYVNIPIQRPNNRPTPI